MGQPPGDIWENMEAKAFMVTLNFKFVNMYRMVTIYVMKAKSPNMLKKKKKKVPEIEKVLKPEPKLVVEKIPKEEVEEIENDPNKQAEVDDEIQQLRAQLAAMKEEKAQRAEEEGKSLKAEKIRLQAIAR